MTNDGIDAWVNDIHQGDAIQTLQELPENSVHMSMCSPPYYGLRDYGSDGQIGLEDSLDDYIQSIVDVADELHRVLRDDGSWWLNLGDSFAGSWGAQSKDETENNLPQHDHPEKNPARSGQLRRKSKMLVPHRVAIALQDAGWVIRSDAVWAKPNPMPHPVKDRFNEHKEFVFHLVPEPDYWFDLDAVREPHKDSSIERTEYAYNTAGTSSAESPTENRSPEEIAMESVDACHQNGKNPGDIMEVSVRAFPEAHFAVYPPELCETPIKSSCPPVVCEECGTPYEREITETMLWDRDPESVDRRAAQIALDKFEDSDLTVDHLEAVRSVGFGDGDHGAASQGSMDRVSERDQRLATEAKDELGGYFREFTSSHSREVGDWVTGCECETAATEPGIVLDPFAGAGTTALVAKENRRRFIGVDLNPDYVALAQSRVGIDVDEPSRLHDDGQQVLTSGGSDD